MTNNYNSAQPEAFITTNKNRRKIQGNNIYLENNTSFEIELFNPTSQVLLGKIKINGNYISDRGLILNPGQRVFLERHIESPEKFLFSTYMVNKENEAVAKAIENNGLVEIEFYPEKIQQIVTTYPPFEIHWLDQPYYSNNQFYYTSNQNTGGSYTCTGSDITLDSIGNNSQLNRSFAPPRESIFKKSGKRSSKNLSETGRVEKGEVSNQVFRSVHKEFESYYSHIVSYKILPISEKNIQVNELTKWCPNCGTKSKKTWKFCASCGNKL